MKTISQYFKLILVLFCVGLFFMQSAFAQKIRAKVVRFKQPDFSFVVPINIKSVRTAGIKALRVTCQIFSTEDGTYPGRGNPYRSGVKVIPFNGVSLNKTIRVHIFLLPGYHVEQFKSYKCQLSALRGNRRGLDSILIPFVDPTATVSERNREFALKEGTPTIDWANNRKTIGYIGKF